MIVFNLCLSLLGMAGWTWVWWFNRYQTGCSKRVQLGIVALGVVWLLLVMADTAQDLQPTSGTIAARIVLLLGCWCLTALLRKKGAYG